MKELNEAITDAEMSRFSAFSKSVKQSLEDKFRDNPRVQEIASEQKRMQGIQSAFDKISNNFIREGKLIKAFTGATKIKYKGKLYDLGENPTGYITISGDVYRYDNTFVLSLNDRDKVVIYDEEGIPFEGNTFKDFKQEVASLDIWDNVTIKEAYNF